MLCSVSSILLRLSISWLPGWLPLQFFQNWTVTEDFIKFRCHVSHNYSLRSLHHLVAVEVFSRKMADLLNSQDNALYLVDDILVYGKDQAEHDTRLSDVLDRFRRANIPLNGKCELSKSHIKWAGHVISDNVVSVDLDRLSAILNMPPPTDVSAIRCFLAMVNQMAEFSSSLAELSAPIRDLLRKDSAWVWDSAK
jgi:hypothetical protein